MSHTRRPPRFRTIDRKEELSAMRKARPADAAARVRRALGLDVRFMEEYIELRTHMVACDDIWMHYVVVETFSAYELDPYNDRDFLESYSAQAKRWIHNVQHGTLDESFFDELSLLTAYLRVNNLPMTLLENGVRVACEKTIRRTEFTEEGEPSHLRLLCERCLLKLLTISTHVIVRSYAQWQSGFSEKSFILNPDDVAACELQYDEPDTKTKAISQQSMPTHLKRRAEERMRRNGGKHPVKKASASNVRPWAGKKIP